jgi:putative CocE/NonD family hydrolase
VGDLDFGPAAEGVGEEPVPVQDTLLRWFTDTLIGGERGGAPVQVFAMGPNQWRRQQAFPAAEAKGAIFYLTADGALAAEPGPSGLRGFTYDPDDPVPTIGGATVMGDPFIAGPRDQSGLSKRADVLLFQTPPLDEPVALEGWVSADLWVESSAVCTDFVARLIDIHPDGRQIGVMDGIVRRDFAAGSGPHQVSIDLWATHYTLAAGHRLGLQVTSSSFPRWSRNPNTGEPLMTAQKVEKARQTVHVGGSAPSALRIGADQAPGRSATGA